MKSLRVMLLVVAVATLGATAASARPWAPRIHRRELRQELRIRQGVRSGELSWREAARLRVGERHIRGMEMRARWDGRVTARERFRIARAQDRMSRRIWRLKHNGCVR